MRLSRSVSSTQSASTTNWAWLTRLLRFSHGLFSTFQNSLSNPPSTSGNSTAPAKNRWTRIYSTSDAMTVRNGSTWAACTWRKNKQKSLRSLVVDSALIEISKDSLHLCWYGLNLIQQLVKFNLEQFGCCCHLAASIQCLHQTSTVLEGFKLIDTCVALTDSLFSR